MRTSHVAALSGLVLGSLAHPFHDSPAFEAHTHPLSKRQAADTLERFRPQQRATYVAEDGEPAASIARLHDKQWYHTFKQTLNGLDIDDADFNVNVRSDGTIFSYGDSFYIGPTPDAAPAPAVVIEPQPVLETVVDTLALPIEPAAADIVVEETARSFTVQGLGDAVEARSAGQLVYYRTPEGSLVSAWRLETDVGESWLTTYVDAENDNNVLAVTDYVADAESYQVFEWPQNDPRGNRRTVEVLPRDRRASQLGWHQDASTTYQETRGNNAIAQPNTDGDANFIDEPRPQGGRLNRYRAEFDQRLEPAQYINASVIQLFYTSNYFRDVLYILSFTEGAGNFQTDNFGRGGRGDDSVILNTQDGSGVNNANFATPPDGQQGRMRMYRFNQSVPNRDSSFEAGIVIHEYAHGLTNRMTGGPANSRCLATLESGGMGEGWSDFYATAIRSQRRDNRNTNYPVDDYAFNNPAGIRAFVYSTNMQTNPYTYSALNTLTRVHQFGTVWCTMLYELYWNLIDDHGNTGAQTPSLDRTGVPNDGKYLSMKLVLDALAFQPCNPSFVQARNAILDADRALTRGDNLCSIWRAFAKRGLGENAANNGGVYTDNFTVPAGVC
ncbi:Putative peptidase M36, fungalysin, FTP domain, peptidase M4/M1, CTD superfamily [Septoria linicola]|uniref:Extracellular metalloproteinase n=1 Tax=Septoria linicola TaxID=215465 RepID=A0A9Q9AZ05_9PEZI|nr:Putative peptidase M36, fungalysin, FTP domain, peptidase M4/M1, CTD superfamily [Septoria linicola]